MSTWRSITFKDSEADSPLFIPLDQEYALFDINGPDSESFLQGQLTNDIPSLSQGQSIFAAHCNAKGRMISSALIANVQNDHFRFRVCRDLLETSTSALAKYMVFSKAELNVNNDTLVVAIHGGNAAALATSMRHSEAVLHDHLHSKELVELWLDASMLGDLSETLQQCRLADQSTWVAARCQLGLAEVDAQNTERYLPQELNFDLIEAVNFKKGCYTGQEVIARLHYRGQLKKHMRYAQCETPRLEPLTEIYDASSQKRCGVVIHSAEINDNTCVFLVLANDSSVEQNTTVTALQNGSKIQWLSLPYAIP